MSEEKISRALCYPYARPKGCYLFHNGGIQSLPEKSFEGRHFVLAIGSNASPQQLRRKYGDCETIPVVGVEVHGLDVVYGSSISGYGSIPATVVKSEGSVLNVHATLLNDEQLSRMHETECSYYFCRLMCGSGVDVFWKGVKVGEVYCYVMRVGAVCNDGIFGIEEICGSGSKFKRVSQKVMQQLVKEYVGWEESVEEFVLKNVENKERRIEIGKVLKGTGVIDDCFQVVRFLPGCLSS